MDATGHPRRESVLFCSAGTNGVDFALPERARASPRLITAIADDDASRIETYSQRSASGTLILPSRTAGALR